MKTAIIIVGAGRGTRAGGEIPKQWQLLGGKSVLARTVAAFDGYGPVILVLHPEDMGRANAFPECIAVAGGASRDASVRAGLEALTSDPPDVVLIHDAARPLVGRHVIDEVLDALNSHDGAAPGLGVIDALWTGNDGLVSGTQNRDGLFRAQTPQGFRFDKILAAHRNGTSGAADDVEMARNAGLDVAIVSGDEANLKITRAEDFARAEQLIRGPMDIRTGNGFDVHRFGPGDHVWLCGIQVPHDRSLQGHSDADVGMHAVTDAIYGALGKGDIGQHFPPSDQQWKGAASNIFLAHAAELVRSEGFTLTHADCTLICEFPKIGPHAEAMRTEMARIIGIGVDRMSVKATTSERLGFTGRGEGIAAIATATLVKS